ncbi:hypothetical protein [Caballeronia sp. TF1N1]|uniref:hypothetical protein n=1 Tax=Caballeronia sp. TF1N1 TaxID=2878153 RepID=UPI001FD14A46|nr:hypothetical protein [Caballeronia sp. TF1N1]
MATDFEMRFGSKSNVRPSNGKNQPEEKAEFWINIGYLARGAGPEGQDIFVALPMGLPLDTMKALKTNSSNEEFAQLNAARNDVWEQLLKEAHSRLQPGETWVVDPDAPLTLEIRRVREETAVSVDEGKNKFVRKLAFAA